MKIAATLLLLASMPLVIYAASPTPVASAVASTSVGQVFPNGYVHPAGMPIPIVQSWPTIYLQAKTN